MQRWTNTEDCKIVWNLWKSPQKGRKTWLCHLLSQFLSVHRLQQMGSCQYLWYCSFSFLFSRISLPIILDWHQQQSPQICVKVKITAASSIYYIYLLTNHPLDAWLHCLHRHQVWIDWFVIPLVPLVKNKHSHSFPVRWDTCELLQIIRNVSDCFPPVPGLPG